MYSDQDLLQMFKGSADENRQGVAYLYKNKQLKFRILSFFKSKGLSSDTAEMLWTDLVIRFSLLVRQGKYQDQNNMFGYLKNLANFMFLNYLRDQKSGKVVALLPNESDQVSKNAYSLGELKSILSKQLAQLGSTCQEIISLWSQHFSMKEIQQKLKLPSEGATRKRKHNCMKSLLSNIERENGLKELLHSYLEDLNND